MIVSPEEISGETASTKEYYNVQMSDVIRLEDVHYKSLVYRHIEGLNIFSVNEIKISPEADPRLIFMAEVLKQRSVPIVVSTSALWGEDIYEHMQVKYALISETDVDLYAGHFFEGQGILIKSVDHNLFIQNLNFFQELLSYDGFALFFLKDESFGVNKFLPGNLDLNHVHISGDKIIKHILSYCDYIVTTFSDGYQVTIITLEEKIPEIFSVAIKTAYESISSNDWFKSNYSNFIWESEGGQALKLKSYIG